MKFDTSSICHVCHAVDALRATNRVRECVSGCVRCPEKA